MKKVILNLVQLACAEINGFSELDTELRRHLRLNGRSLKTTEGYTRKLAELCLHYKKLPEHISQDEINEFLDKKIATANSSSISEFKHCVYGFRYYYRTIGRNDLAIKLPSIKKDKKLPVVLNKSECRTLFKQCSNIKHRFALMLVYAAGLRCSELCNLKLNDVDIERMSIHIKDGKGRRDRYVPLSEMILQEMVYYLQRYKPVHFLFNNKEKGTKLGRSGLRFAAAKAVRQAGIMKKGGLFAYFAT